jgi:hypothetical protein
MESILFVEYPYTLFYKVRGDCRLKKLIELNKRPISGHAGYPELLLYKVIGGCTVIYSLQMQT